MRLRLIAVGSRMPKWVEEGWHEYAKRLPSELALELVEIPLNTPVSYTHLTLPTNREV